ncbi:MAG TPA: GUN4 N-terminal ARM-like repeat domain-containing protein [Coleofasciculaceae cyanobacterium]
MPDVQQSNIGASNFSATQESSVSEYMTALLDRLKSESVKNQLQLLQELATSDEAGLKTLMSFLSDRRSTAPSLIDGRAYQILRASNSSKVQEFLQAQFPQGLVPLISEQSVDYSSLQDLLARQEFQAADRLTVEKMCELAGALAVQRKWLYFTEAEQLPVVDLQTINTLWQVYSEGKFGFSVQRELWLSTGKNWEALWSLIGWKSGNNWTRYPQEFTWDLSAPRGHLPLSNQLRGVRVISALLNHPAWD